MRRIRAHIDLCLFDRALFRPSKASNKLRKLPDVYQCREQIDAALVVPSLREYPSLDWDESRNSAVRVAYTFNDTSADHLILTSETVMQIRIAGLFMFLMGLLGWLPVMAADGRPGCDSCRIEVKSLDSPIKLSGKWLFTRDDLPQNKDVDTDTSAWRLIKAPGPWKGAYDDKKVFPVGWYRGNLEFDPSLSGQEAVLLMNAYMGRVAVYVDGVEVYSRPNNINVERYFSTQAIPVRFKISPRQVIAIRVETPLMTGVYSLPFELHKYSKADKSLVAYQILGGESRMIVAYVTLFFGLFFLLVYWKTRHSLYLVCGSAAIVFFPFLGAPSDYLMGLFAPETMLYLHYLGLLGVPLVYLFSQFYYKFTPKINWIGGTVLVVLALIIGSMAFKPNIELLQPVRSAYFIGILLFGMAACYMLARGVKNRRAGAGVLLFGVTFFLVAGVNDMVLALGVISSISLIFFGVAVVMGAMLYVASNTFANTFVENKRLVGDLKGMNDNLEHLVAERTLQLRQKTNDIEAMLQNMPQGVLTVLPNNLIHPEYSTYLETIFETQRIAGKNMMELVFADTDLGSDTLSQVEAAAGACIGEDRMNFEFNAHLMATEFNRRMADGRVKSLELSWSPICNETDVVEKLMICVRDVTEFKRLASEANAQKRELEIIGEILAVSQEKFQEFIESSRRFGAENDDLIRSTAEKNPEIIGLLFRNMHTIKGNARTYGLLHLTNTVHETEQIYDELRSDGDRAWEPQPLLAQLAQVRALVDEYAKVNTVTLGRKGPGRRGNVERFLLVEKDQVTQTLQLLNSVDQDDIGLMRDTLAQIGQTLSLIGTENVSEVLGGVVESLPSLAKELGKLPPKVEIDDHGIVVRTQISGLLKNLFVHLLRNSMDHGLETAEVRQVTGKTPAGNINIELMLDENCFKLKVRDDGRGLNIAKIRQISIEKNLLPAGDTRSPEEVAQMIFVPGFSTADAVTEVSGRGVGMDAVKSFLEREGGDVRIEFLDAHSQANYRPFEIVITLPGTFAVQARGT